MRSTHAVFLVMALLAIVAGAWVGASPPTSSVPITVATPGTEMVGPRLLMIHVSGWVVAPGVVAVPEGAIVAEAVDAAGGAKPGAALDRINLSRVVLDGELVEVPGPNSAVGRAGSSGDDLILLNRATPADLEALPGVGQVLAERIVAFRENNGPFESVEDLLDVSGIGEAKLASIRDLVKVP